MAASDTARLRELADIQERLASGITRTRAGQTDVTVDLQFLLRREQQLKRELGIGRKKLASVNLGGTW